MTATSYRRWIVLAAGLVLIIGIVAVVAPDTLLFLRSQVPATVTSVDTYRFFWTPDTPGEYQLNLTARDAEQSETSETVTITVTEPSPSPSPEVTPTPSPSPSPTPSGTPTPSPSSTPSPSPSVTPSGGTDGGGGGGSGNGSGGEVAQSCQPVSRQYQAETGHTITGSYSGPVTQNGTRVVKLAHGRAVAQKSITVARDNYWFEARLRHDRPGPVRLAIYVNDRPWKVIKLDRNDNRYRIHRIGLLRNFSGGTIRFRLLNDQFDRRQPTNEDTDRNLFIDWWRLTSQCE